MNGIAKDAIRWIQNGEDIDAVVSNRPANDIVDYINANRLINRMSVLNLNFIENDHRMYEFPNGIVEKQLTDIVTTTRNTVANLITPYGLKQIAIDLPRLGSRLQSGDSIGLLAERTTTNYILRSNDFANAAWSKSSTTVTTTSGYNPDMTTSVQNLNFSAGGSAIGQTITKTITSGEIYTFSIWLRAATDTNINLRLFRTGGADQTDVPVIVTNEWQRFSVSMVCTANDTAMVANVTNLEAGAATVFAYGAQVEIGSSVTSYIGTTTAQVTRDGDRNLITMTDTFRADKFTALMQVTMPALLDGDGEKRVITLCASASETDGFIAVDHLSDGRIKLSHRDGIQQTSVVSTIPDNEPVTLGIVSGDGFLDLYVNGIQTLTVPFTAQVNNMFSIISLGYNYFTGNEHINGVINGFKLIPRNIVATGEVIDPEVLEILIATNDWYNAMNVTVPDNFGDTI